MSRLLPENRKRHWHGGPAPTPLGERFWPKVKLSENGGCAEWTATKDRCGYGLIGYERTVIRAHRAAWILAHGEIPAGMQVLHTCDNPACVRLENT